MKTFHAQITSAAFAVFTMFLPVATVHAGDTINFQFIFEGNSNSQPFEGTGAAPDKGKYWNPVAFTSVSREKIQYTLPGLILQSDGSTRSTVTLAEFKPGGESEDCVGIFADNTEPDLTNNLVNTFLLVKFDGKINLTIGGLTPNASYDLYLYGQNSKDYADVVKFTAPASLASVTIDNRGAAKGPFSYQLANTASGHNGNCGILASQVADAAGRIVIEVTQADFEGAFNGLQVVALDSGLPAKPAP